MEVDKSDTDKLKNVPSGLRSLKSRVHKLRIGKWENTPVDLSEVVRNDVAKRTEYDELVKKVNAIKTTDTSYLVKKADYDTKIGKIEK